MTMADVPAGRDLADALVAKREGLFLVLPRALEGGAGPFGLFLDDVRHLLPPRVLVDGHVPVVLAASDDPVVLVTDRGTLRWALVSGREAVLELRLEGRGRAVVELDLGADLANALSLAAPPPRAWSRRGADGVTRATRIETAPASPSRRWEVDLPATVAVRVVCDPGTPEPPAAAVPPARPVVEADDERFTEVLDRALGDLELLRTPLAGAAYLAAGLPGRATLLGRDALLGALMAVAWDPDVAAGTLRLLATALGREQDAARGEAPGKVLAELRLGEGSLTERGLSYAAPEPTPLFLLVLAEHARWSASRALLEELRDQVGSALAWIDRDLDAAPGPGGPGAGAPLEAQAWAVAAERAMASLLQDPALRRRADRRAAGLHRWWTEAHGRFGEGDALTPGQGVVLLAGAAGPVPAAQVAEALLSPALFSGWGLRTLGTDDAAFDPYAPAHGMVSARHTAIAAAGLRRTGADAAFLTLLDALLDAAAGAPGRRLPARLAGVAREPGVPPAPDPSADRPQATAAGALPWLLVEALGLRPDGTGGLLVERPVLPRPVRRLRLRGLRVGDDLVDLAFERTAGGARLASARGDVEVREA